MQQEYLDDPFGPRIDPLLRVTQLEKNISFLKRKQSETLKYLHFEVEELKEKNRELQLQLFLNQNFLVQKVSFKSEKEQNAMLFKEAQKLKAALKESFKVNTHLSNQVEQLKKESNFRTPFTLKSRSTLLKPLATRPELPALDADNSIDNMKLSRPKSNWEILHGVQSSPKSNLSDNNSFDSWRPQSSNANLSSLRLPKLFDPRRNPPKRDKTPKHPSGTSPSKDPQQKGSLRRRSPN